MQFALLIYESPEGFAIRNNDGTDSYTAAWRAYYKAMEEAGIYVGGDPLQVPETGTTVRINTRSSVRVPTTKAAGTATLWAGTCPGTQHRPPSKSSSSGAKSACSTSCATYGTATASSKPTGRPAAA